MERKRRINLQFGRSEPYSSRSSDGCCQFCDRGFEAITHSIRRCLSTAFFLPESGQRRITHCQVIIDTAVGRLVGKRCTLTSRLAISTTYPAAAAAAAVGNCLRRMHPSAAAFPRAFGSRPIKSRVSFTRYRVGNYGLALDSTENQATQGIRL